MKLTPLLTILVVLGALAGPAPAKTAAAEQQADQAEPQAIEAVALDAYLYLYPLVVMDYTRRQLTNVPAGTPGLAAPMNTFAASRNFPTPEVHSVPRPNFDTLYSPAWVDLTKGPVLMTTPDTGGRYLLISMLDMWTNVFASPGQRTTGTRAGHYLITPPGWSGKRPDGLPEGTIEIPAPTPYVWLIGRIQTNGQADFPAVHAMQDKFALTAYDASGQPLPKADFLADAAFDMKTPPNIQVEALDPAEFYARAAELVKLHAPHVIDWPMVQRLKRIGFEVGESYDMTTQSPAIIAALKAAPAKAKDLMTWKFPLLGTRVNQWSLITVGIGTYGTTYFDRAVVAKFGLGSNVPEDSVYPLAFNDSDGKPFDGTNDYVLHFDASDLPPVGAFWSIALYDSDGFAVANPLNRYAVSSWMPLVYNADRSLDLYIQSGSPGAEKEANWLPAHKAPFGLNMRLYAPLLEAVSGKWAPPAVERRAE